MLGHRIFTNGRFLLLVVALAACSGEFTIGGSVDPGQDAEALIEGDLADQAGLGPLTAECPDTADIEVGEAFECTGTTEDGQVVEFTAEVTDDGAGSVNSTNLATAGDIPKLADEAARILQQQNDLSVTPEIACDDSSGLILEVGATIDCQVTNPDTGDELPAVVTITDPVDLAISVEVIG